MYVLHLSCICSINFFKCCKYFIQIDEYLVWDSDVRQRFANSGCAPCTSVSFSPFEIVIPPEIFVIFVVCAERAAESGREKMEPCLILRASLVGNTGTYSSSAFSSISSIFSSEILLKYFDTATFFVSKLIFSANPVSEKRILCVITQPLSFSSTWHTRTFGDSRLHDLLIVPLSLVVPHFVLNVSPRTNEESRLEKSTRRETDGKN